MINKWRILMFKKFVLFLCKLTILFSFVGCRKSIKEVNINDYLSVEITGDNHWAKAEIIGVDKFEQDLQKLMGEDATIVIVAMIQNEIEYKLDKFEKISNGDVITLSFEINNDKLEKEYGVRVISETKQFVAENLPDKKYMELNPFEYYEVVIEGESPYLTVKLMNNDSFGINGEFVIDYPTPNTNFLKNGDIATVRFTYDVEMAESQSVKVLTGEKIIEVDGYPNNAQSVSEIPENVWSQIIEHANSLAERTATKDFKINQLRFKAYTSVEDAQIKHMGNYFFKPIIGENVTKVPLYNSCFFIYSFKALNVDSNFVETCYLVLTTNNIKTDETQSVNANDILITYFFNDWDELYHKCVKINQEQFDVENNVQK